MVLISFYFYVTNNLYYHALVIVCDSLLCYLENSNLIITNSADRTYIKVDIHRLTLFKEEKRHGHSSNDCVLNKE